jgi:hypothetical protein
VTTPIDLKRPFDKGVSDAELTKVELFLRKHSPSNRYGQIPPDWLARFVDAINEAYANGAGNGS